MVDRFALDRYMLAPKQLSVCSGNGESEDRTKTEKAQAKLGHVDSPNCGRCGIRSSRELLLKSARYSKAGYQS
jgi:hypothetical protein